MVKIIILVFCLIPYRETVAQQVRNTYRFYNTLSTTEPDCAPDLVPTKGLNIECQPSTAATSGKFVSDIFPSANLTRNVYHNNLNWGLKYLNTTGVISRTYTVQIYLKITNFNNVYTRVIDFSDGVEDNGIYFTNFNTPPPLNERCLNFFPNGNFGICPFFNNSTYYLLTITRNDASKLIDIYVNDQLFTSYLDAADFYIGATNRPVHIFRDDPVGFACEDGEANFAYLSFANYYSNQADVSLIYQNLHLLVNTADFLISPISVCSGSSVTANYNGNIPTSASQYTFNWDWDGGHVISGTGRGPYNVYWDTEGTKNITLTITGGCSASITNSKEISITQTIRKQIDTSICPGTFFEGHTDPGTYIDTFNTSSGCDSIRTIKLSAIKLDPPSLGITRDLCPEDFIILSPGNYESYLWQDGSTQKTYTVREPGLYSVTVANSCTTATAQVQVNEVKCYIHFPGAFSPNADGKNDEFKILTTHFLSEYRLNVYNRLGQKIFESTNPGAGWNGKRNGKDADAGVYVWTCFLKKTNMQPAQFLKGVVVLIR